ncbi:hypothetical protein [Bradyrhizobium sp. Tv2a-2]|uniref:hypothetical protein n=1 Tax=Bradyrhizobium sp. Tv2a-2 TaxID=113395 RepID=UPI00046700AC|nr:hypothetical protein [Bradyrhizobium sp. Tv2a-2]
MAYLINMDGPAVFACELARIDRLGPNRRLIFTLPEPAENDGQRVVADLILPLEAFPAIINALASEAWASGEAREITPQVLTVMQTGPARN